MSGNRTTIIGMTLKTQLKAYLDHFDMTAAQLSRKTGVSQQVLSIWLRGGEPKKLAQVKRVAEFFDTTVDHMCFGTGVDVQIDHQKNINSLLGNEWVSGFFEVKLRRVKLKGDL